MLLSHAGGDRGAEAVDAPVVPSEPWTYPAGASLGRRERRQRKTLRPGPVRQMRRVPRASPAEPGRETPGTRAAMAPADSGVCPKTAECILTPVGIPTTGTSAPTSPTMSRAVPSPPAKRRSDTPAALRTEASFLVSREAVGWEGNATTSGAKPAREAASSPIVPDAVRILTSGTDEQRRWRARIARFPAIGVAPSRAASTYVSPSVPCRPTEPPIPAMGLTISPSLGGTDSTGSSMGERQA